MKMKKIILLILLSVGTSYVVNAQTKAKIIFEEAEQAYVSNNFELAVTKLKEVETILKSSNPTILYLQILSQTKIIEKDIWKDYAIIENTRTLIEKYLRECDNIPDLEDKYKEIYKISENFKNAPTSLEDFNERIKQIRISKKKNEEETANFNSMINEIQKKYAQYKWKPNLTEAEFLSYNNDINNSFWKRTAIDKNITLVYAPNYNSKTGLPYTEGPSSYSVTGSGRIKTYSVYITIKKNATAEFTKLFEQSKSEDAKFGKYYTTGTMMRGGPGSSFYKIAVPYSAELPNKTSYFITTSLIHDPKSSYICITFESSEN
jgi:hypothetical protein